MVASHLFFMRGPEWKYRSQEHALNRWQKVGRTQILGKLLCLHVCVCTVLRSSLKILSPLTDLRKEIKNAVLAKSVFSEDPSLKKPSAFNLLKD